MFAAVVFVAAFLAKSPIVDAIAAYVLYARIAQGVVHLIGTSLPLILVRATFYLIQVARCFSTPFAGAAALILQAGVWMGEFLAGP